MPKPHALCVHSRLGEGADSLFHPRRFSGGVEGALGVRTLADLFLTHHQELQPSRHGEMRRIRCDPLNCEFE